MAFEYQSPPSPGPLRQGELVGPVWDHQPTKPPSELAEGENLPYVSIQHTFLMVMSQDCDLLWDYQARFASDEAKTNLDPQAPEIDAHPSCIPHVLMCDCFP